MEYQNLDILNSNLLESYMNQIDFGPMVILEEIRLQDSPIARLFPVLSSCFFGIFFEDRR